MIFLKMRSRMVGKPHKQRQNTRIGLTNFKKRTGWRGQQKFRVECGAKLYAREHKGSRFLPRMDPLVDEKTLEMILSPRGESGGRNMKPQMKHEQAGTRPKNPFPPQEHPQPGMETARDPRT